MRILITGSNGLLGQKLVYQLKSQSNIELLVTSKGANRIHEKQGYDYLDLDITDKESVDKVVAEFQPDCLINCAAMTNVDACELDHEACNRLNIEAVTHLLNACKSIGTHFIHLSTDFIFDGTSGPYSEDDHPDPLSYYASSKLKSEELVKKSSLPWTIIRTIIIYGVTDGDQRSNLVLWVKSSLENGKSINVITDQFRSPTLAEDLAEACISAAVNKVEGVFHVAGREEDIDSIFSLAYQIADYFKLETTLLHPITSSELNQPAIRPPKTGFKIDKARKELNYHPHSFEEGLKIISDQLMEKKPE